MLQRDTHPGDQVLIAAMITATVQERQARDDDLALAIVNQLAKSLEKGRQQS